MPVTVSGSGGTATFADATANFDLSAGAYMDAFQPEGPNYGWQENAAPMVEISTALNGFRGRRILISVWYVAANYSAVISAIKAHESVFNAPCTVTDGSSSYPACYALPYRIVEPPFNTGYSTHMARVVWEFKQMRTS